MDAVTSVVATGIVVTAGTWAQEKPITIRIFVGMGVLAIFLSVIQAGNEKFAQQFAALILVAAVFYYGIPLGKKLGGLDDPPFIGPRRDK